MQRAPVVLGATAAGLAAVLLFHPRTPQRAVAIAPQAASSGTPAPSPSPSAPSAGAGSAGGSTSATGTKVVTGEAVPTQYGNAQVQVTITNGRITEIRALQLQGNDPKSVQISSSAEPVLRQEALQAQSAKIDAVSGATFTSASYEASLQSALDKAGFKAADGSRGSTTVPAIPEGRDGGGHHDGGPDGGFFGGGDPRGNDGGPDGAGQGPQVVPQAPASGVAPTT